MQRHQGNLVVLPHARQQEGRKTRDVLQTEDDDSGQAQPRVQRVHVRYWGIGQIMRIEDCLQGNHSQHEGGHMDASVGELQRLLARGAKTAIHQNGYKWLDANLWLVAPSSGQQQVC